MNKVLIGILLAQLAATAFLWHEAKEAREAQQDTLHKLQEQAQETEKANLNAKVLGDRLDALDGSLGALLKGVHNLNKDTSTRLRALETITQELGDTDESFACLHRAVPAGLDRLLREPAAAQGH
ncbi:hypothetical protein [Bacteriophage Phobos]|uniref:Uncharacterized protein n=1 Tax=Bacteriophage Phobos TaxID=2662138 RepID=A0A5Q2UAC1_9CAUD|nr:hypothetical protein JT319_gp05 [Bacteriophage Phobos]QGH44974.1 hypothetical protein [Bacteriophage Phobos]WPK42370.1 hypothetical protein [Pseudomonas phage Ppu-503]